MRVTLRAIEEADLEVFLEHQQDPEAGERAQFPPREREEFMDHWRTRVLGNPDGVTRTVLVNGVVAGNVVAWSQAGRRLIGYWLGREFWGRGVGTIAIRQFLALERARPLYAEVHLGNTASLRLLERCGFRRIDTDTEFALFELAEDEG